MLKRLMLIGGLIVGLGFVPGIGLFVGDIDKLCRIKYFTTGLAFDELYIVLAGDDLYDGMFAGWGHEHERRMVRILPVLPLPCQGPVSCDFSGNRLVSVRPSARHNRLHDRLPGRTL